MSALPQKVETCIGKAFHDEALVAERGETQERLKMLACTGHLFVISYYSNSH